MGDILEVVEILGAWSANLPMPALRLPVTNPDRTRSPSWTLKHSDVSVMSMEFARVREHNNGSLDLLTEVGAEGERAVVVQLLVTSPAHGIAHSLYLNLSSKFQSFPIGDVRNHELCLPNLAR